MMCSVSQFITIFSPKLLPISPGVGSLAPQSWKQAAAAARQRQGQAQMTCSNATTIVCHTLSTTNRHCQTRGVDTPRQTSSSRSPGQCCSMSGSGDTAHAVQCMEEQALYD